MKKIFFFLVALLSVLGSFAQTSIKEVKNGWHLLDQQKDGYLGISLEKAYELLKGQKSTTVIVAVIDSGIDTTQEDLKEILWKNEKEISGNGIDDDGNGYTDDIYGWNFCGAKDGENVVTNSLEIARVYHHWKSEFEDKKKKEIPDDKKFLYSQWLKAADIIEEESKEAQKEYGSIAEIYSVLTNSSVAICNFLSVKEFTATQLKTLFTSSNKEITMAAALWSNIFQETDDPSATNSKFIKELTDYKDELDKKISMKTRAPEDFRGNLVRDNYTDITDRFYGNNNLKIGSGDHGTLVAGTIAAIRNNGIGMNGIADNVRMCREVMNMIRMWHWRSATQLIMVQRSLI